MRGEAAEVSSSLIDDAPDEDRELGEQEEPGNRVSGDYA